MTAPETAEPAIFDPVVMMERLSGGQRVERYVIEAWDGSQWNRLAGTTIGHKKIDIFSRTTASRVRLRIVTASSAPQIRESRLYDGADK